MNIYKQITVDLYNEYPIPITTAKQYDTGRGLIVTVTTDGGIVDLTGTKVRAYFEKPDGTDVFIDCVIENNKAKVIMSDQVVAVPGIIKGELEITAGDIISNPVFEIIVYPSIVNARKIVSTNDFQALQEALQKSDQFEADITQLQQQINDKVNIVVTDQIIPIGNRKAKTFYYFIKERQSVGMLDSIKVSPNMGLKLL